VTRSDRALPGIKAGRGRERETERILRRDQSGFEDAGRELRHGYGGRRKAGNHRRIAKGRIEDQASIGMQRGRAPERLTRCRVIAAPGSEGLHATVFRMPGSDRACRLGSKLPEQFDFEIPLLWTIFYLFDYIEMGLCLMLEGGERGELFWVLFFFSSSHPNPYF